MRRKQRVNFSCPSQLCVFMLGFATLSQSNQILTAWVSQSGRLLLSSPSSCSCHPVGPAVLVGLGFPPQTQNPAKPLLSLQQDLILSIFPIFHPQPQQHPCTVGKQIGAPGAEFVLQVQNSCFVFLGNSKSFTRGGLCRMQQKNPTPLWLGLFVQ